MRVARVIPILISFFFLNAEASSGKLKHFENRRTAEEYVHTLSRAQAFLKNLGFEDAVVVSSDEQLRSEFLFLPSQAETGKFALVDSRLKLNPEYLGRITRHSGGSYGIQLPTGSRESSQQVAIHISGVPQIEIEKAVEIYLKTYNASSGGRGPASETVATSSGAAASARAGVEEKLIGDQLWNSFRACGSGFVRGMNQILVYPVYAANAAWVYVFGDALGVGKIDPELYSKDPVQAVFASGKKRYKSAFTQSWEQYWAREKDAALALANGVKEYKTVLAKGYNGYVGMTAEEKSAFNCAVSSGLGAGALAKVATQVSLKAAQAGVVAGEAAASAATATQTTARVVETPLVSAVRRRIETRQSQSSSASTPRTLTNQEPAIKGLEVREIVSAPDAIDVPPDALMKIYGKFDPSKIKKSVEPPKPPPPPMATGKRYSAILDVGDGRKMPVQFEVLTPPSARGYVQIRYENPLHRGQLTERSIRWGELEISPGFRELTP